MNRFAILLACTALTACDGGGSNSQPRPDADVWEIGPTLDGQQYSKGSVNGNTIRVVDVHYVTTKAQPPLTGTMRATFRLSAPLTGTIPEKDSSACNPARPATANLYFQRAGDDWTLDKGYRWWASFNTVKLDHAGEYTIIAPLDGPWTSDESKTAASHPQDFASAKANAERVGFTLGNCQGRGHGATGPADLTIIDFGIGP